MVTKRSSIKPAAGAKPKTITAWSYSRYRDWKRCPFLAKCKHVDRLKEPGSPAMERGGAVHKMAQDYVEAKRAPAKISDELACFEVEFKDLRKAKALCENEWAFRTDWTPTGWFDADAWCRVKMDAHYVDTKQNRLVVIDHKTGKVPESEEYVEQEELYAVAGLLKYPDVDDVEVKFWYLDAGEVFPDPPAIYTREQLPALMKKWGVRVKPMLADTRFPPRANWACGRCHFSKAKGGPCKF